MKTILRFMSVIFICLLIFYHAENAKCFGQSNEDFHFVTSFCGEEHTLKNVPEDLPFVLKFPMEQLLNDPSISDIQLIGVDEYLVNILNRDNEIDLVRFNYRILTSIPDAEFFMVGLFCGRQLGAINALDLGREGEIGDNCWYGGNLALDFIRNNVVVEVLVSGKTKDNSVVLQLGQLIDTLIVNSEKVNDALALEAPVIHSVDIVSGKPELGDKIILRVNASEPNDQVLRYDCSILPGALSWLTNNIIELPRFWTIEALQRTYILWVMNEDFKVSAPVRISFLLSAFAAEEGATPETPHAFTLNQNAPNPFNPGTAIGYELTQPGQVSLRIYDLLGREIAVPVDAIKDAGHHEAYWNGKDSTGKPAASGVYLYRLETGGSAETRRMMLVR